MQMRVPAMTGPGRGDDNVTPADVHTAADIVSEWIAGGRDTLSRSIMHPRFSGFSLPTPAQLLNRMSSAAAEEARALRSTIEGAVFRSGSFDPVREHTSAWGSPAAGSFDDGLAAEGGSPTNGNGWGSPAAFVSDDGLTNGSGREVLKACSPLGSLRAEVGMPVSGSGSTLPGTFNSDEAGVAQNGMATNGKGWEALGAGSPRRAAGTDTGTPTNGNRSGSLVALISSEAPGAELGTALSLNTCVQVPTGGSGAAAGARRTMPAHTAGWPIPVGGTSVNDTDAEHVGPPWTVSKEMADAQLNITSPGHDRQPVSSVLPMAKGTSESGSPTIKCESGSSVVRMREAAHADAATLTGLNGMHSRAKASSAVSAQPAEPMRPGSGGADTTKIAGGVPVLGPRTAASANTAAGPLKVPFVFMHGVGLGVFPYLGFVSKLLRAFPGKCCR
jgi:hypothetical protein